jgi:hypothetical protein
VKLIVKYVCVCCHDLLILFSNDLIPVVQMSQQRRLLNLLKQPAAAAIAASGLFAATALDASYSAPGPAESLKANSEAPETFYAFRRNRSVRHEHQHSAFHAKFAVHYPNLMVMPMTPQLIALHTIIRKSKFRRLRFRY